MRVRYDCEIGTLLTAARAAIYANSASPVFVCARWPTGASFRASTNPAGRDSPSFREKEYPMAVKRAPSKKAARADQGRKPKKNPLFAAGSVRRLQRRQPAAHLHLRSRQDPQPPRHRPDPAPAASGCRRGEERARDGAAAVHHDQVAVNAKVAPEQQLRGHPCSRTQ